MKSKKILLIALITALLSFSITLIFYAFYFVEDVQYLDMKMKVGESGALGFDVNRSVISFGTLPRGGYGQREVTVENMRDIPLRVYLKKSGKMAQWVYISEDSFILKPYQEKKLNFTAIPPKDAEFGPYKGKVKLFFLRI